MSAPPARLTWVLGQVVQVVMETPRTASLQLEVAGWPGHLAGQHIDVRLTAQDGYQAQRSYSIASAADGDRLAITVERLDDGEVSPYLVGEVRAGDQIELRGPIGGFFVWRPDDGRPLLLVAGGSGMVPLMAMLRTRAGVAEKPPARLLYSARTAADVIYRDELESLGAADQRLMVHTTLTRSQPAGWTGYSRRVDRAMLQEVGWPPDAKPAVFICGPTAFVEAAAGALVEIGCDPSWIKTERFGATGG
jgi:ferredoxin-NADP reductase